MIQWLTTVPNRDGQQGWRRHAVEANQTETLGGLRRRRAVCGLVPRNGWGLDLFIEDKCARCEVRLRKFPNLGR